METKNTSKMKKRTAHAEKTTAPHGTLREDKILNTIINTSVILMSTMMGAFTQVMVNATGAMASGMAAAMGGKEAEDKVNEELTQKLPEVDEKMKAMITDIRKDIYAEMGQKRKRLKPLLSDALFEAGPKIVEKYDFNLPKLTEELDDNALAQYSKLLVTEDSNFQKMFKELTEWLSSLPKASDHPEPEFNKDTKPNPKKQNGKKRNGS